jgi:hypothetical protein
VLTSKDPSSVHGRLKRWIYLVKGKDGSSGFWHIQETKDPLVYDWYYYDKFHALVDVISIEKSKCAELRTQAKRKYNYREIFLREEYVETDDH